MLRKKLDEPKVGGDLLGNNKIMRGVAGVGIIFMSFGVYVQALPLIIVFLGSMIGVYAETDYDEANTIIWILTSVGFMIPAIIAFYKWCQFIWFRFVGSLNDTPK